MYLYWCIMEYSGWQSIVTNRSVFIWSEFPILFDKVGTAVATIVIMFKDEIYDRLWHNIYMIIYIFSKIKSIEGKSHKSKLIKSLKIKNGIYCIRELK